MTLSNAERQKRWRQRQRETLEPLMLHRERRGVCAIVELEATPLQLALHELGDALYALREANTRQMQRAMIKMAERNFAKLERLIGTVDTGDGGDGAA